MPSGLEVLAIIDQMIQEEMERGPFGGHLSSLHAGYVEACNDLKERIAALNAKENR